MGLSKSVWNLVYLANSTGKVNEATDKPIEAITGHGASHSESCKLITRLRA